MTSCLVTNSTALKEFKHIKQVILMEHLLMNCQDKENLIWYMNGEAVEAAMKDVEVSRPYLKKLLWELKKMSFISTRGRGTYIILKRNFQTTVDNDKGGVK
jgi:hypothetical protein